MSLLEKFAKENPNFTFDDAHMKRVNELEKKHVLMATNRMTYLSKLAQNPDLFSKNDKAMFAQGYIDCGYEYETQILQTIFDADELKFMEVLFNWTTVTLPGEQSKKNSIIEKLKMLQSKLEIKR